MAYESRHLRRQKIRYENANDDAPLKFQLVKDGAKITPTSATVTIYDPSGDEVLAATALTVSGTLMTKAVSTTTVADYPVDTGYRAHVIVTHSGGTTEEEDFLFDVVKFLLDIPLGFDQLVARDDRVRALEWNGDEDLSEIIEACRDELQLLIETKAINDGQLLENMILDSSRVAIPFRQYVLAAIFEAKGQDEAAARYRDRYDMFWRAMLDGIKYDVGQDLVEDASSATPQVVRFEG